MSESLPKVVITDFINDSLAIERQVLEGIATVVAFDAYDEESLHGKIESAKAVMLYHNLSLSAATIERLTDCKLIVRCGVGFDNVDHARARQLGIPVANVPDYGTEEVADSAIGMALSLTRGIHFYNQRMKNQPDPWMYHVSPPLFRHRGRVFGIIGMGRIGTATARRALAMGMDVRFFDPFKPDGYDKANGVTRVETLEELVLELHAQPRKRAVAEQRMRSRAVVVGRVDAGAEDRRHAEPLARERTAGRGAAGGTVEWPRRRRNSRGVGCILLSAGSGRCRREPWTHLVNCLAPAAARKRSHAQALATGLASKGALTSCTPGG